MPSMPAKNSRSRSWGDTFSCLEKKEVTQKQTAAPSIRRLAIISPEMPASMAALPMGAISPHMLAAANSAMWAFIVRIFIIFSLSYSFVNSPASGRLISLRISRGVSLCPMRNISLVSTHSTVAS